MNRKAVSGILLTLLLVSVLSFSSCVQPIGAEPKTWTVDDDRPADFHTIQEAVSSPQVIDGDVIYVYDGTYWEDIIVYKAVSLIGKSKDVVIHGGISVYSDDVTIRGFKMQRGRFQIGRWTYEPRFFKNIAVIDNTLNRSIQMFNTFNATIQENKLINGGISVEASPSSYPTFGNNTIVENSITNASIGILVRINAGNKIIGNTLNSNDVGILLEGDETQILDNLVENGGIGMHMVSVNNRLAGNRLVNNRYNFGFGSHWAYPNYIDTSNTINGMPIYYLVNQNNMVVDPDTCPDIGFLALIDCMNVTVKDTTLSHNGQGILLERGYNNTLLNCIVADNVVGIWTRSSTAAQETRHTFADNTISHNGVGMWLVLSSFNNVVNNTLKNNSRTNIPPGIRLHYGSLSQSYGWTSGALSLFASTSNMIIGNTMASSDEGIYIGSFSGNNTLRRNSLTGNLHNFGVDHHARGFSYYIQDIDPSNTGDNKPIIYWVSQHENKVPEDAGYVALVNCTNITIENLNLSRNRQGILMVSTNSSVISDNRISKAACGIVIRDSYELFPGPKHPSTNGTFHNNTITACGTAICLYSGPGHAVSHNDISDNIAGIHVKMPSSHTVIRDNVITNCTYWDHGKEPHEAWLWDLGIYGPAGINLESSSNVIVGNTLLYCDIGMTVGLLTRVGGNVVYHNNFINNLYRHVMIGSLNIWDNGYPSGGNYWSDYEGEDLYNGPFQNETRRDGIGDAPYLLDKWIDIDVPPEWRAQKDNYPLVHPWCSPSGHTYSLAIDVKSMELQERIEERLVDLLEDTIAFLEEDREVPAIMAMFRFMVRVRIYHSFGLVTQEHASHLMTRAMELIYLIWTDATLKRPVEIQQGLFDGLYQNR